MFRGVLHFSGNKVQQLEAPAGVAPPRDGFVWIDLEAQTRAELDLLGERFGFHPLTLEDCEHLDQIPKLELYDGYLFMVIHSFTCTGSEHDVDYHELHLFFSKSYLITVHRDPSPVLEGMWKRVAGDTALCRRGLDFILYELCDQLVDTNFPILDQLSDAIDAVENAMLPLPDHHGRQRYRSDPGAIHRILALKRSLVGMRKILSPQREVFNRLAHLGDEFIAPHTTIYFRDIYDHLVRLYEQIDTDRDLLGNVLDAHFSVVGQRTNEIVIRLTLVSIIFLPLTFITGFFGMNFTQMPFSSDVFFWLTIAAVFLLPGGLLLWFRSRRWFR